MSFKEEIIRILENDQMDEIDKFDEVYLTAEKYNHNKLLCFEIFKDIFRRISLVLFDKDDFNILDTEIKLLKEIMKDDDKVPKYFQRFLERDDDFQYYIICDRIVSEKDVEFFKKYCIDFVNCILEGKGVKCQEIISRYY